MPYKFLKQELPITKLSSPWQCSRHWPEEQNYRAHE